MISSPTSNSDHRGAMDGRQDEPTGRLAIEVSSGGTPGLSRNRNLRIQDDSCDLVRSRMTAMTPAPVKPLVKLDLLNQIDIRVGTILSVSDVPNSENLMQLRVDFGDHEQTVVAGIRKERENPRVIEGKQALFVVNLEPRKLRGVLSDAMLFDIGYADGVPPVLALPESPVPNGTRAG